MRGFHRAGSALACLALAGAAIAGLGAAVALGAGRAQAATPSNGQLTIAIDQNNVGTDAYQTAYNKAFIAAAKQAGVHAIVLNAGGSLAHQISQMQDLIQQKPDVIILWPHNAKGVIPVVCKAHRRHIPVVITNSNIAKPGFKCITAFSGPNSLQEGREAAKLMCQGLHGHGKIVVITGTPGYKVAINRRVGFDEQLKKSCPEVKIMATQPSDWNRAKAQQVMEDFLTRFPKIDGVYAEDDNIGIGALNAAEAAGRANGMVIVGATLFDVGYEAIKAGKYYGSIEQSPIMDAQNALRVAIKVAKGEKVPFYNYIETPQVTQKNVDQIRKPAF
jgi:ribose transport system substrate-binding protein